MHGQNHIKFSLYIYVVICVTLTNSLPLSPSLPATIWVTVDLLNTACTPWIQLCTTLPSSLECFFIGTSGSAPFPFWPRHQLSQRKPFVTYLSPARANANVKTLENVGAASFRILFTSLLIQHPIIQSYTNWATDIAIKQATNKLESSSVMTSCTGLNILLCTSVVRTEFYNVRLTARN